MRNESGATAIEYALIAALIAAFVIDSLSALGTKLGVEFNEISSNTLFESSETQRDRRHKLKGRPLCALPRIAISCNVAFGPS